MVKHLRHLRHLKYGWVALKRLVLVGVIVLLGLAFWLHAAERSLSFAKPWIENAVNSPDAPYVIAIGNVTVDWTNVALLGKLHITQVTAAKRDGNIFAQLPEVYATIDPIGFLPTRHLLHKVIVREPRIFAARNKDGAVELGFEGSPARVAFSELVDFFSANGGKDVKGEPTPLSLPMHDFQIKDATLTFTDEATDTKIISSPFNFQVGRKRGNYEAAMSMPFTVDDAPVKITAQYRAQSKGTQHVLMVNMLQFPGKLLCQFDTCPEKVAVEGKLDAMLKAVVADDFSISNYHTEINLPKTTFVLPDWFAEPLKITGGSIVAEGDWSKKHIALRQATLPLTDTTITASGTLRKAEDGWYATADAAASRLEVSKIYKYWPLIMAPDSRKWVTSKLKAGYAAKGTMKLNLTPADFAADVLPDAAVDAVADARDISFEYLPGFPLIEHMDGIAHFTATTVKVEGTTGSMLGGTKISHAVLWCPKLNEPSNPMEVDATFTAPANDAATMLALKHFAFDDNLELNPATIKGLLDATMKLKFDAFSGHEGGDPNEIHLEKVDYDIAANLHDVAQDKIAGSFDAKSVNGALKANNDGLNFTGSVRLGEAGTDSVKLSQPSGKPLSVEVKGIESAQAKMPESRNDFALSYTSGAIPQISVTGKRMDMRAPYGASKGSALLSDFPAMKLNATLDEILLARDAPPLQEIAAALYCTPRRCESADFKAKTEKSTIKAGIQIIAGARQFLFTGSDAGSTLKAFGITDRMMKGKLEMNGHYDDKAMPPAFSGKLRIDDFTLKNSEILGRIFAIGSLTGLQNALTGSGISFDKMVANIDAQRGIITVSKGMAQGTSIGITTDGTIDTTTTKMALKGVVVPAYALNSILGKIPIIGALAGGEEGLIAFNYYVKGGYDNPDVGVNPLSGLTPGFLRGIFGMFDGKQGKQTAEADKAAKSKPVGLNQSSAVHKR